MKYCPYCGAALMGGAVSFCSECGKKLLKKSVSRKKHRLKSEKRYSSDHSSEPHLQQRIRIMMVIMMMLSRRMKQFSKIKRILN